MRSSLSFIVYNSPCQPQCELKRPSRLCCRREAVGSACPGSPALKGGDHKLEMQPVVLQIPPLGLDMLEGHPPVQLEL
jgi:hypothetical protein